MCRRVAEASGGFLGFGKKISPEEEEVLDSIARQFAANHPDAPADLPRLFEAGLGGALYAHWPFVRLVLQGARLAAVHSGALAARLGRAHGVEIETVVAGSVSHPRCISCMNIRAQAS